MQLPLQGALFTCLSISMVPLLCNSALGAMCNWAYSPFFRELVCFDTYSCNDNQRRRKGYFFPLMRSMLREKGGTQNCGAVPSRQMRLLTG